jgi:hypothetical protein
MRTAPIERSAGEREKRLLSLEKKTKRIVASQKLSHARTWFFAASPTNLSVSVKAT